MGFFDFLNSSKRSARDQSNFNVPELRAQSYDTTAIALPPIRGTLPVAGNGPNTLPDLKRAAKKRSEAQLTSRTFSSNGASTLTLNQEPAAPAPLVPRLRSRSKSVGRPSTAPSIPNVPLPLQRPKSAGRNANFNASSGIGSGARRDSSCAPPKFVMQKSRPGPPYLLGMSGPGSNNDDYGRDSLTLDEAPPVPPIAAQYKSPLPAVSLKPKSKGPASINGSVMSGRSGGGKVGYVDLLDAQGQLRPADFKTRLQAAGARDYGEDVAERNMGVNGVDLESPAVLAFYALTGGGPLAFKSDGSAVDVHGNKYRPGQIPENLQTEVQGKGKDELSDMANKRIRTPKFPLRTTSLQPSEPSVPASAAGDLAVHGSQKSSKHEDFSSNAKRRRSMHGAPPSSLSQQKLRPLSMNPVLPSPRFDAASTPEVPLIRPTTADPSQGEGSYPSLWRDSTQAMKMKKKPAQLDKDDRTQSLSLRDAPLPAPVAALKSQEEPMLETHATRSLSNSSRKSRKSAGKSSDFSQFDFGVDSNGDPINSAPSSRCSSRQEAASDAQLNARPTSQRSWQSSQLTQSAQVSQTTQEPTVSRSRTPNTGSSHPRNRSVGGSSLRGRTQLDDISEHIPKRRSSWRNESLSSMAPSTTMTACSPQTSLDRPQSHHTADTSLDLGTRLPSIDHYREQQHKPQLTYVDSSKYRNKPAHVPSKNGGGVRMPSNYQAQRAQGPNPFMMSRSRPQYGDDHASITSNGSESEVYTHKRWRNGPDHQPTMSKHDYDGAGNILPGLPGHVSDDHASPQWHSYRPRGHHQPSSRPRPPTSAPRQQEPRTNLNRNGGGPPVSFPMWEDDDTSSMTVSESENEQHYNYRGRRSTDPSSVENNISSSGNGILSNVYDPLEAEMDDQFDARLAMRLRKELKRRERAAARRKTIENYEQGHVADTEN